MSSPGESAQGLEAPAYKAVYEGAPRMQPLKHLSNKATHINGKLCRHRKVATTSLFLPCRQVLLLLRLILEFFQIQENVFSVMQPSLRITAFVPFPFRYPVAPDKLLLPDNFVWTILQPATRPKIKLFYSFIVPTFPFPQLPPLALPDARRAHLAPRHVSKSVKSTGYGNPEP